MRARNTFPSLSVKRLDSHSEHSPATEKFLETTRESLELAGLTTRQAA